MKPCVRLGDDERQPNSYDARRLAEDDLDTARILLVAGDLYAPARRLDAGESDNSAFGLRDDLLREHDHVAVLELELRSDEPRPGRPFLDLRQAGDRDDAELAAQGSPVRRDAGVRLVALVHVSWTTAVMPSRAREFSSGLIVDRPAPRHVLLIRN